MRDMDIDKAKAAAEKLLSMSFDELAMLSLKAETEEVFEVMMSAFRERAKNMERWTREKWNELQEMKGTK